jgi:hypothetical protein
VRFKDRYAEVDWDNNKPDQLWFLDLKLGNKVIHKPRIINVTNVTIKIFAALVWSDLVNDLKLVTIGTL